MSVLSSPGVNQFGYELYDEQPGYRFEIPVYATVETEKIRGGAHPGWLNLEIPALNGKLHLS